MAHTYTRTVTVVPSDDNYEWQNPAGWITINQVGSSDTWEITVSDNTTSQNRSAILTVNHSDGATTNSITVNQAGTGGITASPTPQPSPSSSAIPPTPTPSNSAAAETIAVTFNNTSLANFLLDDDNGGKGGGAGSASLTYSYNYSGTTSGNLVPVITQIDPRISVTFAHGTSAGGVTYGSIYINSIDTGGCPAQGLTLTDLIISHPGNSNATYTLNGSLTQAFVCNDFQVYKGTSPSNACLQIGSGADTYSSADATWQNGTILFDGANGSITPAEEDRYYIHPLVSSNAIWYNRIGGLGLELSTSQCSDFSTSS